MKNKEIEELLSKLYKLPLNDEYKLKYSSEDIDLSDIKLLLSYIEQLETDYKEAIESVTWWRNRYNAIVKQNDDNHKKVVKLENNRNKAVREIMYMIENGNIEFFKGKKLENILMGDNK